MQINALLSSFPPVAVRGGESSLPLSGGPAGSASQDNGAVDVFVQGQPSKNMATAKPIPVEGENASDATGQDAEAAAKEKVQAAVPGPKGANGQALTQTEQRQVAELESIDIKVRAHEQAHLAAAGSYATAGASFQYANGPDGKRYAVAGEVGIDTGKESSPEATIRKMQTVRAAALAPVDPSPQDRRVAAKASLAIVEAGQELQSIRFQQAKGKAKGTGKAETGLPGKPVPQEGEKVVASESKQGKGVVSEQQQSALQAQQKAVAIMAGLTRPASRIHITV